jgi:16S rRNA G966 N2-methylase RsmD
MTWMSFKNPLVIEKLDLNKVYFKSGNSKHKAVRSFNSFVKSNIFDQFKNTEHVMDIASGRGQDLFRYSSYGIKHILFLEVDKTALQELIKRKFDFARNRKGNNLSISIQQIDIL